MIKVLVLHLQSFNPAVRESDNPEGLRLRQVQAIVERRMTAERSQKRTQPAGSTRQSLRLLVLLLVSLALAVTLLALGGGANAADSVGIPVRFVDIAKAAGIDFQQDGTA